MYYYEYDKIFYKNKTYITKFFEENAGNFFRVINDNELWFIKHLDDNRDNLMFMECYNGNLYLYDEENNDEKLFFNIKNGYIIEVKESII